MKIKQEIVNKINTPLIRTRIAARMGIGEQTFQVRLRENASNGRLTKMDALRAISEELGVAVMDILVDEKASKRHSKHTV